MRETRRRRTSLAAACAVGAALLGMYFRKQGQLEQWGTPAFRRRLWLRAQGRRVRRLISPGPGFAA
jgi:hypothetical protein